MRAKDGTAVTNPTPFDLESAVLDPAGTFATPADVIADPRLDRESKLRLLRQWERDARALEVAEEENMGGGEVSMLGRVRTALDALGDEGSGASNQTTKHGG